jgi:hypothetical protein
MRWNIIVKCVGEDGKQSTNELLFRAIAIDSSDHLRYVKSPGTASILRPLKFNIAAFLVELMGDSLIQLLWESR